jgi:adenine/guanine phosphoribosyltransferase-like PRPP-binding protein
MAKNILIQELRRTLIITLQSIFDITSFEILIKSAYSKSRNEKFSEIKFDFSKVTWIEPFQLSQLALWILELKELKKQVSIIYPTSNRVLSFLNHFHFDSFVENNLLKQDLGSSLIKYASGKRNKPFLPLTIISESSYQELFQKLQQDDYYNLIFDEVRDYAITRKGLLLNIVVKELGDNMFLHGDGRFSNLILSKGSTNSFSSRKYSPFESIFFSSIKGLNYIEVIISDKGKGISANLKDQFIKKYNIPSPDECSIIDYATNELTTSRSKENRLKEVIKKLSVDIEHLIPFTGLFQVKEIVKRYRGLLIIRSGHSIISYDNYGTEEIIVKSSDERGYKGLIPFGGTQIRFILPIIEGGIVKRNQIKFDYKEVAHELSYFYISCYDYFISSSEVDVAEAYENFIQEIERVSISKLYSAIIIDFTARIAIDSKVVFLIIAQLMVFQSRFSIVYSLVNFNVSLIPIISDAIELKSDMVKCPLVIFTESFARRIVGLDKQERKIFDEIIYLKEFRVQEHVDFGNRYPHLFNYIQSGSLLEFRHNRKEIIEKIIDCLKQKLHHYIEDGSNKIYYKDIQVLIPSGKYSSFYYEIDTLFKNKEIQPLLLFWIKCSLMIYNPDIVLSIGSGCGELMKEAIRFTKKRDLQANHYIIYDNDYFSVTSSLGTEQGSKRCLVFTDVIASGKTLSKILDTLEGWDSIVTLTVVDFSTDSKIRLGTVDSIIRNPTEFDGQFPPLWTRDQTMTVDRKSNKLLSNENKSPQSFTSINRISFFDQYQIKKEKKMMDDGEVIEVYKNPFLENLIIPNGAFYIRVYNSNGFMPIMFNINLLVKLLVEQFTQDIVNDIFQYEFNEQINFKYITYLDYETEPFKPLIRSLLTSAPRLESVEVNSNQLNYYNSIDKHFNKAGVIIIDDAFTTGESLFKLIDYCDNHGAEFIFCYLLIKRSDFFNTNKFIKLKKYGNARIAFKFIFDAEIPVYKLNANPVLSINNELDKLSTILLDFEISSFLFQLKKRYEYLNILDSSVISTNPNSNYLLFRWQLEMAKRYMSFRKDISNMFEDIHGYKSELLTIINILEQEKGAFFEINDSGYIFYPSFKERVINAIKLLLDSPDSALSTFEIYDLFSVFISISINEFYDFIDDNIHEFSEVKYLYPLITVLSVHKMNYEKDLRRYILIEQFKYEDYPHMQLIGIVEKIWKSEDKIYKPKSSNYNSIKTLFKSNFHDFKKVFDFLETGNVNIEGITESWYKIKKMCNTAVYNMQLFFENKEFEHVEKEFYKILREISNAIVSSDALMQTISGEDSNLYHDFIKNIEHIRNLIFSENGLIFKMEANFRIELKSHLRRRVFNALKNHFKVDLQIAEVECNVFCSDVDMVVLLTNVTDNIINHSQAHNVLLVVRKKASGDKNIVICEVLDDGNAVGESRYGIGLNNCSQILEKYSGEFHFKRNITYVHSGIKYHTKTEMILQDLSSEILNRPKYAEEVYNN